MHEPVVVTHTRTVMHADLLVGHLRREGIEAMTRTNLDRATYAGLGGAVVLVEASRRLEAEFELMMLEDGLRLDDLDPRWAVDGGDASGPDSGDADGSGGSAGPKAWVRLCGYVTLGAMALATVVPSAAVIWRSVGG